MEISTDDEWTSLNLLIGDLANDCGDESLSEDFQHIGANRFNCPSRMLMRDHSEGTNPIPEVPRSLCPTFELTPLTQSTQFTQLTHMISRSSMCKECDVEFQMACSNQDIRFNPYELGFVPLLWQNCPQTFGQLVTGFFWRKSGINTRFIHKLFNALRISVVDDFYFKLVGVAWVTDRILKVDKIGFARLLGIRTIDGSLFYKQGNFPSHGFVEIPFDEARRSLPRNMCEDLDFDLVRLFVHESGEFYRGCSPAVIRQCKWFNFRKDRKGTEDEMTDESIPSQHN
jgi:hypothetical protein